jgi:hypothetical protein
MKKISLMVFAAALVAIWAAPSSSWSQTQDVGHFSQVVNHVNYQKQGKGPEKPAKVKDGVENKDVVKTKELSRAKMRFIDNTLMTVGPKTELTIEDYMYDASKGKRSAVVEVYKGVVETVTPHITPSEKPNFIMRTPTATAGIRGTKYYTVVGPNFTAFYVVEGKLRVQTNIPGLAPDSVAMKCVAEGLRKRLPLEVVLNHCLESGLDPCSLIKAAIIQRADLRKVIKFFMDKSREPKYREVSTPFIIMRCATIALRAMKEEDASAGKYAMLIQDLAPIVGEMGPGDLARISNLTQQGIPADMSIPHYPPSESQIAEAAMPDAVKTVANALIDAGANPNEVNNYANIIGYTPPALEPIVAPTVSPGISSGGGAPPPVPPSVPVAVPTSGSS